VQVVPHITNEIKERVLRVGQAVKTDVCIVEIARTIGDIESLPFLEAIRQFRFDVGREKRPVCAPVAPALHRRGGELKTKPTQKDRGGIAGHRIQPDIILCRTSRPLNEELRSKISLFCNIEPEAVFEAMDVASVYEVPLEYHRQKLDDCIVRKLGLKAGRADLKKWEGFVHRVYHPKKEVEIAIAGKYIVLPDAYKSIAEALLHAGVAHQAKVRLRWVDTEEVEQTGVRSALKGCSGVLVPGGFGDRGIEGKIQVIQYARQKRVPFFGICLGMQCAVIEFARHVVGFKKAHSTEFNAATSHPVIHIMEDQLKVKGMGGTMRLGSWPCKLEKGSRAMAAYRSVIIKERHRHRYEFNNAYRKELESAGMRLTGLSPDDKLVEIVEIPRHPWFVGSSSTPNSRAGPCGPTRCSAISSRPPSRASEPFGGPPRGTPEP
jgi:CTP synthase